VPYVGHTCVIVAGSQDSSERTVIAPQSTLLIAHLPLRAWLTLPAAPLYIAWKCWIYAASLFGRRASAWVRTQRFA